jgi:hypothetical protein
MAGWFCQRDRRACRDRDRGYDGATLRPCQEKKQSFSIKSEDFLALLDKLHRLPSLMRRLSTLQRPAMSSVRTVS